MHDTLPLAPDRAYVRDRSLQVRQAAARLWALHGYHAVSLHSIAMEAGVSPTALHRLVSGKPALLALTLEELITTCEVARRRLVALQRGPSPWPNTAHLASSLAYPIEQLCSEGSHGRHLLMLWLRHWQDPAPELSTPLRHALLPLQQVVVSSLMRCALNAASAASDQRCPLAFASAIAVALEAHTAASPERARGDAGLPKGLLLDAIVAVLARSTSAGLKPAAPHLGVPFRA